jgi:hypothetical protein
LKEQSKDNYMAMTTEKAFGLLGVTHDASISEINKAFRRKAATAHPDRHPGDVLAEERYKEIVNARDYLLARPQDQSDFTDINTRDTAPIDIFADLMNDSDFKEAHDKDFAVRIF